MMTVFNSDSKVLDLAQTTLKLRANAGMGEDQRTYFIGDDSEELRQAAWQYHRGSRIGNTRVGSLEGAEEIIPEGWPSGWQLSDDLIIREWDGWGKRRWIILKNQEIFDFHKYVLLQIEKTQKNWAAQELGSMKTEKKAISSRENGKKGGRPKNKSEG